MDYRVRQSTTEMRVTGGGLAANHKFYKVLGEARSKNKRDSPMKPANTDER